MTEQVFRFFEEHHGAATAWVDSDDVTFDAFSRDWLHARQRALGWLEIEFVPEGYYLFVDGEVRDYNAGMIDTSKDGLSMLFGAIAGLDALLSIQREGTVQDTVQSAGMRASFTYVSWKMFLDHPLFGCGFGQYKEHDIEYLDMVVGDLDLEKARPYHQHNVFLAMLSQTGLLGFGAWMIMLGLWTRNAWLLWSSRQAPLWARQHALLFLALLAAYSFNGMFHDVSIISMVNMLLFFVAGVCQGLVPLIHGVSEARPVTTACDRRVSRTVGLST